MYTVEITRGLGWESPALIAIETMDGYLDSAEKFARQSLTEYQKEHPDSGASGFAFWTRAASA